MLSPRTDKKQNKEIVISYLPADYFPYFRDKKVIPAEPAGLQPYNKEATPKRSGLPGDKPPKTDERGSTSHKNRSGVVLAPIVAPVSLHKFCFTVSDTLECVDTNTFGTCALHRYASKDFNN